jgi:predicted outer membrane repeat protein
MLQLVGGQTQISNSFFVSNSAPSGFGGSIYAQSANLKFDNGGFSTSSACGGGAIASSGGSVQVSGTHASGCSVASGASCAALDGAGAPRPTGGALLFVQSGAIAVASCSGQVSVCVCRRVFVLSRWCVLISCSPYIYANVARAHIFTDQH